MSWLYSRALGEAFSEASCSDGVRSALSSGSPIPQAFCAHDKTTDFSRLSRFGMTFKPLTDDLGEELLMWFLADSRARTSALPERVQASTENGQECGEKWRGWLAKYDPASSSWRTPQRSFIEGLDESSATLPSSGMTRGGLCWELPTLEPHTKGTDSGSLGSIRNKLHRQMFLSPTASEDAAGRPGSAMQKMLGNSPEVRGTTPEQWAAGTLNPTWTEWLMGWPLGWTDLKPLATVKSHCVQLKHSGCSPVVLSEEAA